ncbi:hypothetical protein [Streptomyces klenkii]|uniref:hypothetical protein n=1 Tax=Streptomyces klenkii TaxID=1420899 RepID=UPI00343E3B68
MNAAAAKGASSEADRAASEAKNPADEAKAHAADADKPAREEEAEAFASQAWGEVLKRRQAEQVEAQRLAEQQRSRRRSEASHEFTLRIIRGNLTW